MILCTARKLPIAAGTLIAERPPQALTATRYRGQ
jgi:hypothetical protein